MFIYLASSSLSWGMRKFSLRCIASLVATRRLQNVGASVVVTRRFNCSAAYGNFSSLTRDWTCVPCIARWILRYWTTKEIPKLLFLYVIVAWLSSYLIHWLLAFLIYDLLWEFCPLVLFLLWDLLITVWIWKSP